MNMKNILVILFVVISLIGCANPVQTKMEGIKDTINELRPKAEAGTLKWSEYYQIIVDKMKTLPSTVADRDAEIQEYYYGIEIAKKYESGLMSKEDFYKWREDSNAKSKERGDKFNKMKAECEYEAVSRANPNSSVEYAGNNINNKMASAISGGYEIAMRRNEIFTLCMKSKSIGN